MQLELNGTVLRQVRVELWTKTPIYSDDGQFIGVLNELKVVSVDSGDSK